MSESSLIETNVDSDTDTTQLTIYECSLLSMLYVIRNGNPFQSIVLDDPIEVLRMLEDGMKLERRMRGNQHNLNECDTCCDQ